MNAKFFDLKKDKQDRIINAAIKIFALNGYTHASTDEIVKEAHISKGLLFHYFESKIGAYSFMYDYSTKYLALEYSSAIDPEETSYITLRKQMEAAKMQTLKTYPYMQLFINRCAKEKALEAVEAIDEKRLSHRNAIGTILARADINAYKAIADSDKYLKLMDIITDQIMEEFLLEENYDAEAIYAETISYIDLIEKNLVTETLVEEEE